MKVHWREQENWWTVSVNTRQQENRWHRKELFRKRRWTKMIILKISLRMTRMDVAVRTMMFLVSLMTWIVVRISIVIPDVFWLASYSKLFSEFPLPKWCHCHFNTSYDSRMKKSECIDERSCMDQLLFVITFIEWQKRLFDAWKIEAKSY